MQLVVKEKSVVRVKDMSEQEFLEFCRMNDDLRIERTAEGEIVVMPPAGSDTGYFNSDLNYQLRAWAKHEGRGLAFDSSAGFILPNGAMRSPDASWIERSRILGIEADRREGFLPICPDFVIELLSRTDSRRKRRGKMREWIDNGAQLGWLVDPGKRTLGPV